MHTHTHTNYTHAQQCHTHTHINKSHTYTSVTHTHTHTHTRIIHTHNSVTHTYVYTHKHTHTHTHTHTYTHTHLVSNVHAHTLPSLGGNPLSDGNSADAARLSHDDVTASSHPVLDVVLQDELRDLGGLPAPRHARHDHHGLRVHLRQNGVPNVGGMEWRSNSVFPLWALRIGMSLIVACTSLFHFSWGSGYGTATGMVQGLKGEWGSGYGIATGMVQGLKGGWGSGHGTATSMVQGLKGGGLSPLPKI